jgi:hypothetical protein
MGSDHGGALSLNKGDYNTLGSDYSDNFFNLFFHETPLTLNSHMSLFNDEFKQSQASLFNLDREIDDESFHSSHEIGGIASSFLSEPIIVDFKGAKKKRGRKKKDMSKTPEQLTRIIQNQVS